MISALSAFRAGISDLRWYIEAIELEWALLAAATATPPGSPADALAARLKQHVGVGVAKRRFDYNSIVISLYGILEQYVEALLRGFVANLNSLIPRYPGQPGAIKNSHLQLSFGLLSRAEQSRYRGAVIPEDLIANLHSCLSDSSTYRINTDAFCHHSANFRADVVDETFGRVGITGVSQRLRWFPPLSEYVAEEFPDRDVAKVKPEETFFYLNDLAERRNEVAHGSASELLSNKLLLEYVRFIEVYGASLYELAYCHSLEYVVKHQAVELGEPVKVFNNSIVCVELRDTRISVGDTLIAITGNSNRPYVAGEVEELQVDNKSLTNVPPAGSVLVGAKVTFRAKENYKYCLVQRT